MTTLVDRLIARVAIADSGCWEWQGALTEHGYGRMSWQGVVRRTHRLAAGHGSLKSAWTTAQMHVHLWGGEIA